MLIIWTLAFIGGLLIARASRWGRILALVLTPIVSLDALSWLAMCVLEENYDAPLMAFAICVIAVSVGTSIILLRHRKQSEEMNVFD